MLADATTERKTKNEGAIKAGDGAYVFDLPNVAKMAAGAHYSSAFGSVVEGERTQVGLMRKAKGTGARPHSHPNEQWNYVVQGRLRVHIEGEEEKIAGPGTLIFFPANKVHATVALPEEDVYFFVVKDLSFGIAGIAADGQETGAFYEKGFEPKS
ncbi:cupin domain-containing protein [Ancylobacter mangrovi]|uniref:cupin domain-containing protein n=1 Tax=Ancylobacter mangrovi TaxID=2972472 RepID=UPI0021639D26|nr:cupin domain-containing protein [Ancylobacter mangrovi]MCS0504300.1 cupin domain-containing protein [Ancylobacter mangrovi]